MFSAFHSGIKSFTFWWSCDHEWDKSEWTSHGGARHGFSCAMCTVEFAELECVWVMESSHDPSVSLLPSQNHKIKIKIKIVTNLTLGSWLVLDGLTHSHFKFWWSEWETSGIKGRPATEECVRNRSSRACHNTTATGFSVDLMSTNDEAPAIISTVLQSNGLASSIIHYYWMSIVCQISLSTRYQVARAYYSIEVENDAVARSIFDFQGPRGYCCRRQKETGGVHGFWRDDGTLQYL